jgi:glycerophosphoryl diester phosphodiesterase
MTSMALRSPYLALLVGAIVSVSMGSQKPATAANRKVSIAHRGASSYAPEHTGAAYRLAIQQGADYVEQDLAVTRDSVLICLHDDSLERTTNIEEVFPDRYTLDAKGQKRWLAADFTLAEVKRLDAGSWFSPAFANERLLTWDEAVDIVWGKAGMYPELKTPALYRDRGVDMVALFVHAVSRRGLKTTTPIAGRAPLVLQSFDEQTVRELARLLPEVPRTFLLGSQRAADPWLTSAASVKAIATFATDLGPAKQIVEARPEMVRWAHEAGLTVTPYTFRADDTGRFANVEDEMRFFLFDLGVDALFTDNPDKFPRRVP